MRDISCHTRGTDDIVQRELGDSGVKLQEEGQRLANPTGGPENGDLRSLYHMFGQPMDWTESCFKGQWNEAHIGGGSGEGSPLGGAEDGL